MRRPSGGTGIPRPSSAPVETITPSPAETTVTLPLRRSLKPSEDKGEYLQKIIYITFVSKRCNAYKTSFHIFIDVRFIMVLN